MNVSGVDYLPEPGSHREQVAAGGLGISEEMPGVADHADRPTDEVPGQGGGAVLRSQNRDHVVDEGNVAHAL